MGGVPPTLSKVRRIGLHHGSTTSLQADYVLGSALGLSTKEMGLERSCWFDGVLVIDGFERDICVGLTSTSEESDGAFM